MNPELFFNVIYPALTFLLGAWCYKHFRTVKFFPLSRKIAQREGGQKNTNIAQINEILKITLKELGIRGEM